MTGPRNRRQIRRTKKTLRRSGSVKRSRAREKDWTARTDQDWDELAPESLERVMPRDDLDRRKQIEQAVTASPLTSQTDPPERPRVRQWTQRRPRSSQPSPECLPA